MAERARLPRRHIVAALIAGPVLLLFEERFRGGLAEPWGWLVALFLVALLWWCSRLIRIRARSRLLRRRIGPEFLIVFVAGVLLVQAWLVVFAASSMEHEGKTLWLGHAFVLIGLWNLGRVLRRDIRDGASRVVRRLESLTPDFVRLTSAGGERLLPQAEVRSGDRIRVAAGERVPIDARLASGQGKLDEYLLTGVSRLTLRRRGDPVVAGALNRGHSMVVEATRAAADGTLPRLVRSVHQADRDRPDGSHQYARLSAATLIATALIAALAALAHAAAGSGVALVVAMGVLVMAAPPALTLASIVSVRMALARVEEYGVRVRRGAGLRAAQALDVLLLDAGGVITTGLPEVVAVEPVGGFPVRDLFRYAASLAANAEQGPGPVTAAALERDITLARVTGYQPLRGGHRGRIGGRHVIFGTGLCLAESGIANPLSVRGGELQDEGSTPWYVVVDGELAGVVALGEPLRPETVAVIRRVRGMGLRVVMMASGDLRIARAVAGEAGIDEVVSRETPEERAAFVHSLQRVGLRVGMVGNGLNDVAALIQADAAVAMATASDVAAESADMTLVGNDLAGVFNGLAMARAMRRNIRQNMIAAYAYNGVALLVATGLLHSPLGWALGPGTLLATSGLATLTVMANGARLRHELIDPHS